MNRWRRWLGLCLLLVLAQGCVQVPNPESPSLPAESRRFDAAAQQAGKEARKAALARQKAEDQQHRAAAEAQKVAAQQARRDAALADAQAKRTAAEAAKQRAVAEKEASEKARLAEAERVAAEKQRVRAEALAAKIAERQAREAAAVVAAAESARQREQERLAADKAKQQALTEKEASGKARHAEAERVAAEKQRVRAEALAAKTAERQAREAAALAAAAESARQREQERLAAEAAKQEALAAKQAEETARRSEREQIAAEKQAARAAALASKTAPKPGSEAALADARLPAAVWTAPDSPSDYVLRPGDEIDIQVYREPELSGTFKIDPSGDIRHSLAGAIPMAGKTIAAAEKQFTRRLAKDYLVNPRVIVKMVSTQSSQIVVLGEVKKPGVYPLPVGDSMTLLQAIAGAGGFTELASPERVRIVRKTPDGGQTTLRVRVSSLLAGKGRQQDVPLEPNDVIMVPDVVF